MNGREFDDWIRAPNIVGDPSTYELENEAIRRDGRVDAALEDLAPLAGTTVLDIGCGTGFWLPGYAERARHVFGVEPDPMLVDLAGQRTTGIENATVRRGSAEHLPVDDAAIDVAHARFAYFFGAGCEAGLAEVERVLRPTGVLLAIDNSWTGGDFARLLRAATTGNAVIDSNETDRWWAAQGAHRHEIDAGWSAASWSELDRILRIEFPERVVDDFMASHTGPSLTYQIAIYEWRPSSGRG